MITFNRFPGGKFKAVTVSYDDGVEQDRRLVGIFNRHGIKATFAVNAGLAGNPGRIPLAEMAAVYAGHEVAAHGFRHPSLARVPEGINAKEIIADREALEKALGRIVRGMTYPNGSYDAGVIEMLAHTGIAYARTTHATREFELPERSLAWHPTCHHREAMALFAKFAAIDRNWHARLFYFWGHSYELDHGGEGNTWEAMEQLCATIGGRDDIWYATNLEVVDYLDALRRLQVAMREDLVHNPSAIPVWVVDGQGETVMIGPGETRQLALP
jgi:hypothetical protein